MVFPARQARAGWTTECIARRLRRGAAPIPVYRWDLNKYLKPHNAWRLRDKVATGRSPVAPATPAFAPTYFVRLLDAEPSDDHYAGRRDFSTSAAR